MQSFVPGRSLFRVRAVTMQRQVELIGAAWGLGGADPGCAEAPAVLAPLVGSGSRRAGSRRAWARSSKRPPASVAKHLR